MSERPKHSPTGASTSARWMACPGSVGLIAALGPRDDDGSPAAAEGTAAHEALAKLLTDNLEPWEILGEKFGGYTVDLEMLDAVEVGVKVCRSLITPATDILIEQRISHPDHAGLYGTVDFATVTSSLLNIVDYKHGIGVVVEVENNPQIMYYAYGLLLRYPSVRRVVLRIVQPRAHHPDGPVRRWETTAEHICSWATDTLLPAMQRAQTDNTLDAGAHCRFCPARLICPLQTALMDAAANYDPKRITEMTDSQLGTNYRLALAAEHRIRAIKDETFRRLQKGREVPGTKLVPKRANRMWRDGIDLMEIFGARALNAPSFRSPAEMEKLDGAKPLVRQYAYMPEGGLTVVLDDDKRDAVKVPTTAERYAVALANMAAE